MAVNRNEQITNAINPLTWWAKEPAMMAAVITSAVIATIDYFELTGHSVEPALLALVIAWINVIGLVIRSQYTPYANR